MNQDHFRALSYATISCIFQAEWRDLLQTHILSSYHNCTPVRNKLSISEVHTMISLIPIRSNNLVAMFYPAKCSPSPVGPEKYLATDSRSGSKYDRESESGNLLPEMGTEVCWKSRLQRNISGNSEPEIGTEESLKVG